MTIENIEQRLDNAQNEHAQFIRPVAHRAAVIANEINDWTVRREEGISIGLIPVVRLARSQAVALSERIGHSRHLANRIEAHAHTAHSMYTELADGTTNANLRNAVDNSGNTLKNGQEMQRHIAPMQAALDGFVSRLIALAVEASDELRNLGYGIESAAYAAETASQNVLDATEAYREDINGTR